LVNPEGVEGQLDQVLPQYERASMPAVAPFSPRVPGFSSLCRRQTTHPLYYHNLPAPFQLHEHWGRFRHSAWMDPTCHGNEYPGPIFESEAAMQGTQTGRGPGEGEAELEEYLWRETAEAGSYGADMGIDIEGANRSELGVAYDYRQPAADDMRQPPAEHACEPLDRYVGNRSTTTESQRNFQHASPAEAFDHLAGFWRPNVLY
jgi:hypothetical protein